MKLTPISVDALFIGQPLPYSLWDREGVLLAQKGFVLQSRDELSSSTGQPRTIYIDTAESEVHRRAYMNKLHDLVREDIPLGQIADSQFSSFEMAAARDTTDNGEADWLDLQSQAHAMLRDKNPATFLPRLEKLQTQLSYQTRVNPDGALLALIHLSSSEVKMYSATHALLVAVMCTVAAREVLKWPTSIEATLCNAALTMNLGMTELQDRLAQQKEQLGAEQKRQVGQHAIRSVVLLEQFGVTDQVWLEAVLDHHSKVAGPLASRTQGQRIARLIQRADVFSACLAPRAGRVPATSTAAMKACYFDETRQMDEAGAALIKTVGIYSPGSFVRLNNNELAVVIKRGANTTTPRVAVLINREGMPTGEMMVRDTQQPDYRIVASVAHRDVKVGLNLERLLALSKPGASDRPW
jgi:HD-GYP domain-containing protein (c-di-GMP phosphodiesterase class II)